jgi:hypothetical protein
LSKKPGFRPVISDGYHRSCPTIRKRHASNAQGSFWWYGGHKKQRPCLWGRTMTKFLASC